MKARQFINGSWFFKLSKKLFVDDSLELFNSSVVLRFLNKFYNQKLSFIALILAVICLLYKSLLAGTFIDNYNIWFLLLALSLLTCNKKAIRSYRAVLFLAGFVVFGVVGAVLASINGVPLAVLLYGVFLSLIFPLFFIVASTFDQKYYRLLPGLIIVICLPLLLAGLWQLVSGVTTPQYWVSPVENLIKLRVYGWSDNPNNLGAIAMVSGLIATFAFWKSKKWYFILYALLAGFVTVMTFSRASWLGWGLALIIIIVAKNWRYIFLSLLALLGLAFPSIRQRLLSTFDPQFLRDSALDGRVWAVGSVADIFKSSPVVGTGPGTYGNSAARDYISPAYSLLSQKGFVSTHMVDMQWQQILCQYGVVGILLVTGFFISYFVNMLGQYRKTQDLVFLAMIVILVAMLLTGFLENVWFFAPLAGLYGLILGSGLGYANNE